MTHPRSNFTDLSFDGPAAIAFSGGGDSTAMIHAFRNHPQVTHAYIIDHNLRQGSAEEVAEAAEFARSLGYAVQTDCWDHEGVSSGIQVKARNYRYSTLGGMCRDAGIQNLLTAHTADDQAETLLMRLDRQTAWRGLAGMPAYALAPLWPELWNVHLHRPWLDVSRIELRDYNQAHKLNFVDDPSNENRDFTRVRARQALSVDIELRQDLLSQQKLARARLIAERNQDADWVKRHAKISVQGFIETDVIPSAECLLHLLNAVSGRGGPIDAAKRAHLLSEMSRANFNAATLAGAWVVKTSHGFVFARDMVAVTGRNKVEAMRALVLKQGQAELWDGRFSVTAKQSGVSVEPAFGSLQDMRQEAELKQIFNYPKQVRGTLPLFKCGGEVVGFGAADNDYIQSTAMTAPRLQGLC